MNDNPYCIRGYRLYNNKQKCCYEGIRNLLEGEFEIEKIKPKTLMEQLKEQGFGYAINIHAESGVEYVNVNNSIFNALLKMGAMYLTESDCKREMYRRELEFEMQEWARENDCLSTVSAHLDCQIFKMFNVYVRTIEKCNEAKTIFNGKAGKYYNWGD